MNYLVHERVGAYDDTPIGLLKCAKAMRAFRVAVPEHGAPA